MGKSRENHGWSADNGCLFVVFAFKLIQPYNSGDA